jgi:hypothetical protein
MTTAIVAYYRVSTQRQGRSGLGLEAQRKAVAAYAAIHGLTVADEFTEIETARARTLWSAVPCSPAPCKGQRNSRAPSWWRSLIA